MGVGVSNPVDEQTKQDMQDLIKNILGTFTVSYTKAYALALVEKIKMDTNEKPQEWKLLQRPPWNEDFKKGWLMKEGGIRKSWKKRYFVVRPNYSIDYYVSDEEAKKENGKKKGSISLAGYSVVENVNDGIIKRLAQLAEKMGMNVSDLPKPKEYPKYTIELHHHRRRCWFLQCENEEEYKQWVEQFKTCCRRAWGLKNQEFCHKAAFEEAVIKVRWNLGHWGWYSYGGSEEQILSDLISEEIDWKIMGKIYSKITGPWMVRNQVRNQVLKVLDTTVSTAVAPAWKAMEAAVNELRPKIEPTIKDMVGPIFKAEGELVDKMKQGAMSIIDPILKEKVAPHLSKIVECVKSPLAEGFEVCFKLFDEEISKFEVKGGIPEVKKSFYSLDWYAHGWNMWPALDKVDPMYDPLWALHAIFEDIYPWSLIWTARDLLREKMDNAIYTFEQRLIQQLEASEAADKQALVQSIKAQVLDDFKSDAFKATVLYYHDIMKVVVMPPFEKVVIPACQTVIDPISELIPEPLKQFLDPGKMFEDLIDGIVDDCIDSVLSADQSTQQTN